MKDSENTFFSLFKTRDELKTILSEMPTSALFELSKELNISWKETSNSSINRMRCYLAICNNYFPLPKKKKKRYKYKTKQSPWNKYTTDALLELLDKYKIKKPKRTNDTVCRMWAIHYLNERNINPYKEEKE